MHNVHRLIVGLACLVALGSCADDSPTGPRDGQPAALLTEGGQDQSAVVGSELTMMLTAKVVDRNGSPVRDHAVNFRVISGGGSVSAGVAVTSDSGIVRERWTLGTSVADSQRVEARAVDAAGTALVSGVFRASARADVPASVEKVAGDSQTVVVGTTVADSLAVRVLDRFSNAVPLAIVRWAVTSGGGVLSADSSVTNAQGIAKARWTAGGQLSSVQRATASVGSLAAQTFHAITQAAPAAALAITVPAAGALSGAPFTTAPRVRLVDAFGNPAVGTSAITLSVSAGGTLLGTTTVTSSAGEAAFVGTGLSGAVGTTYTLTYSALELTPVTQTITVVAVQSVSAGNGYTMILRTDGTLWGTGTNDYGKLGDGTVTRRTTPVPVMTEVQVVAAGYHHTVVLKADGTLWATGRNYYGALGDGTTTDRATPVQVMSAVQAVSTGVNHTMILKTDGTLWATGESTNLLPSSNTTPQQVMSGVQAVAAGRIHWMILKTDGSLWATGANGQGQLGDGTTTNRATPVQVMSEVRAVAAGYSHTMMLKTDGTLWATGQNNEGQVGDGTTTDRATPIQVMSGVQAVAAGFRHTMILKTDGTLWATGSNGSGQLGDGTTIRRTMPVQVMSGVRSVSAGAGHTMILKTDGTLWAMGGNGGSFGDGTTTSSSTPVQVLP